MRAKLSSGSGSVPTRPHFPSLDGLRCLAIVPIVWHHSTTGPMDGVLGRGPLGVDLFFVVSGFLITTLLLREREHGEIALGQFWIRRSLRIFPLYYLVLGAFVLHALVARPPGPVRDHFLHSIPYYATYTSNWFLYEAVDHPIVFAFAWSLATEEQFYLVWPPILRACRGLAVPALVMAGLVALDQMAERGLLAPLLGSGLALVVVRSFATPIGLGALLALAGHSSVGARAFRAILGHRAASAVALTLVVVALVQPWPLLPTHAALATLVAACTQRRDHLLAPLLENAPVRHVGTVSYGVYLLNVPVVSAVRRVLGADADALPVFAVAMIASIMIATIAYRCVERPFLVLRDRFRPRARRSPKPSLAPSAEELRGA